MSINPLITNFGPNASLYAPASGGGGGGGGDNPIVSTLTFNGGASAEDIIFPAGYTGQMAADAFVFNVQTAGPNNTIEMDCLGGDTTSGDPGIILQAGVGGTVEMTVNNGAGNIYTYNGPFSITPGRQSGSVQAPGYGMMIDTADNNSLYTFSMANNNIVNDYKGVSSSVGFTGLRTLVNAGSAYVGFPSGPGGTDGGQMNLAFSTLALSAPSTLSLTAPTVLVNGVPYGGGGSVGPNLGLSSLSFGGSSNPAVFMENKTIQLNPAGSPQVAGLSWNNSSSNIQLIGPSSNYVYIGTTALVGSVSVNDTGVTAGPALTTSSLTVSSVNGAAYPPPASGQAPVKLTWSNAGSNVLTSNMTPGSPSILTSASYAVTNGHTYRMTAAFGLSNTIGDGQTTITIEGTVGGLPANIWSGPNSALSTGVFLVAGYSGYFTAAGGSGGVTVGGTNTGTGVTTVIGDNAYVILEDLGAI